jgi:hypothetical protein
MTEKTLVEELISPELDEILLVREQLGADIAKVSLITRTWSGVQVGDGEPTEAEEEMHPAPRVVNLAHNVRLVPGGAVEQGDLILKMISKNKYPAKTDVNCQSTDDLVEKFYRVNGSDYRVIEVVEQYVTWDVQIRRLSNQTRR